MTGATGICGIFGHDGWAVGMNVFKSWMSDASCMQKEWLAFFNRRLDKERSLATGLMQCASLGVLIDLQTEFWGELASDYAQWAQRGLCWLGDTTQHAVGELGVDSLRP